MLHSISTLLSHHATFYVLSNTRIRLLDKLAALPLGAVLDRSSGAYKNIIVEHVDSIETTLAHLLPEMTANIAGALAVLAVLFLEDWRMGFSMLIVVPLGILCFMSMFRGYSEKFQRTVTSTKALNDTAVEYISGIEVIKAFGQSKTSYAKFVFAAKESADCFIDWMRGSLFGQVAGMAIFPSTLLGILPVGCLLYMHRTLSAETFLAVIVLSFGVMQPLITALSYTDDIAQVKIIIGEVAEVLSGTETALRELANFTASANNKYDSAYVYYRIINNCNYYIAHRDTMLMTGSHKVAIPEYVQALSIRAWAYMQLCKNYGTVDFYTTPITSISEANAPKEKKDMKGVLAALAPELTMYKLMLC